MLKTLKTTPSYSNKRSPNNFRFRNSIMVQANLDLNLKTRTATIRKQATNGHEPNFHDQRYAT